MVASGDVLIRCPKCNNILGAMIPGGTVHQKRDHRHSIGLDRYIQCEKCHKAGRVGAWLHPDYPRALLTELQSLGPSVLGTLLAEIGYVPAAPALLGANIAAQNATLELAAAR